MDGKTFARIGAIVFVAVAITATAIDMSRTPAPPAPKAQARPSGDPHDPLGEVLDRCSQAGEAGAHDPQCLKAWADNRRRFLGQDTPAHTPPELPATGLPEMR